MPEGEFDPSDMTALVLDENAFVRGLSLDQLRAMGFGRSFGASTTAEAWDLLLKNNPSIVLIEWCDGDALDFVRRVRQSEDAPNRAVSIFMLTSRGNSTDVETARRAGVDGYLRKPISALALGKRVRRVVSKPQPFVASAGYTGPCRRRRGAANYAGPWRRLDDAAPAPMVAGDEEELDLKAQLARANVAALQIAVRAFTIGDAAGARAVNKAVGDLVDMAQQIGDDSLRLGAEEMARYIKAQGATEALSLEVVQTHVAALHQLAHLPHSLAAERKQVADSLKRMVDKKLRQAASAA